jgi:serine/threonine-protein kinase
VDGSFAAGLVGIVLDGRYRLDALLGEGGMGAVYRATQLANDRKVAVKLLKPHLTTDEPSAQRFLREARSTLKVESEHAVKVLDFGITPHGDYYMALEYLDGRTVQRELDVDGPFAPARVVHIAKHALDALGAAHARGIIHRDIKPDNLLLMRAGDDPDYTKVLDFGVAKLLDQTVTPLTAQGMVFGTPEFMSPEQACGLPLDGRSDLYALAATMFAMLTGRGLYNASTPIEWLTAHARKPPPHLADARPELAPLHELDRVLQQCLAKHKDHRPADARAMIALLESIEPTLTARPSKPMAATMQVPALKPTVFSASTYVAALPSTGPVPVPTRRGRWIVLGALVIAAMIAAAIAVSVRDKKAKPPPPAPPPVVHPVVILDAGVDAVPADASIAVDAAIIERQHPVQHPRTNPEVDKHLAAAEAGRRAHKWVQEIEQANAALALDPRSVKARLMIADGLLHENDLQNGCKYLRELGRNPLALARAREAGCPTD